ncbi:WxL domain-containing protein [Enterococcus faecalis]|uniref:WxL domain-containing protein n=1 Tax=Enterococcus faecalis TaxID=1351 RepID=UPI001639A700|nr:WxL domain-containing protein [Enterococcus faecalis]MBC2828571.1 WxL domain-containing protein [Enterococcus faecalis]
MRKKLIASLLVSSAVVGASLAPLSAQATTTGDTPVTAEFAGGTLPDQEDNTGGSVDPDPGTSNTDFDLLTIPNSFDFPLTKIREDLSALKENSSVGKSVMVGDVRGTKEGWHVTGEIMEMSNGADKLDGQFDFGMVPFYARFDAETGRYKGFDIQNGVLIADDPVAPTFSGTSIKIGGGATTLANATVGKGQGMWGGRFDNLTLNVTTPTQQLKKGVYTGNIVWNLVAGPSI